jgi:hypothetical protein
MQGTEGKSFGIVTKAANVIGTSLKIGPKRSVPLSRIEESINALIKTANENPNLKFLVTKFGTNMAGFTIKEMKSLLVNKTLPDNIILPKEFEVRTAQPTQPQAKKATTKDTSDIKNELGMLDAATNERLMGQEVTEEVESQIPLVDPESLPTPTNLSYDVYVNKFTQAVKQGNEKFKDMLSEQEFNKHNPQVKEKIIKCL